MHENIVDDLVELIEEENSDFVQEVIILIKETPLVYEDYMCHGEPHSYIYPDYEKLESGLHKIIKARGLLFPPRAKA